MQFFQKYSNNNNNLDKNLLIGFSFLIIVGGILNTLSNKTYLNDSWTIGEWLINYQGGFIRRGFLGEGIYLFSNATKISPIFIIWLISISSYYLLIKLTFIEAKNKISDVFLLSPCIFMAPIIGDFLVRKDLLLLLIFLISLKLMKSKSRNIIISHDNEYKKNYSNFVKFIPSLCFFICCLIFKGDQNQAISIHQSWLNNSFLFPFENLNYEFPLGAINAIGWDFKQVLKILLESLIDFKGILWVPLAWLTTTIFLASFFLGDNSGKDFRIKFFILSLQFFPFSILCFSGWDYGRWIFVWIVSSILIYCTFGEELKTYEPIQKNLFRYDLIKEYCFNIEIHKRSKILLAIFAYPHCCWSLFYLPSLLIIPSYSILKKFKLFFK